MTDTRICVVGCGAIGGLFASHLARLEAVEVWTFHRTAERAAAINAHGLRVSALADVVGRVHATADPDEIPACDFGVVCTKSADTGAAIRATAHAFADAAGVCSMQNGVGNEEILADFVPRVMRGTTFAAGSLVGPAEVAWRIAGDTWIGPFERAPAPMAEVVRLAELISAAGLRTLPLADARGAQWAKLIFNAAANAIGALTRLYQVELYALPATRRLASGIMDEGKAVAAVLGIELASDPEALMEIAGRTARPHRASMLEDVLARRPTEVDVLNGAIVASGLASGVPTPLNHAIVGLIKGLERSWAEPGRGGSSASRK